MEDGKGIRDMRTLEDEGGDEARGRGEGTRSEEGDERGRQERGTTSSGADKQSREQ